MLWFLLFRRWKGLWQQQQCLTFLLTPKLICSEKESFFRRQSPLFHVMISVLRLFFHCFQFVVRSIEFFLHSLRYFTTNCPFYFKAINQLKKTKQVELRHHNLRSHSNHLLCHLNHLRNHSNLRLEPRLLRRPLSCLKISSHVVATSLSVAKNNCLDE